MNASPTIWTIGHGRTPFDQFISLLQSANIQTLVDVRSVPYSRHAPHASKERLHAALPPRGIGYVFLGDRLGGRPKDPNLLTPDGNPDYGRIASSTAFNEGLNQVIALAKSGRICLMCAEENPDRCHRTKLIAPVLLAHGASLIHLRHDGRAQPHETLF